MAQRPRLPVRGVAQALERALETWLFRARWLLAPFYVGLVASLVVLLAVFVREVWVEVSHFADMSPGRAILMALGLIDLTLGANLVIIVIFSGYENFVSKMDNAEHEDRPSWMGTVDFSGLKMKVIASIVVLTAVALLRVLVRMAEGESPVDGRLLGWAMVAFLSFVVAGLILALMDFVAAKTPKH